MRAACDRVPAMPRHPSRPRGPWRAAAVFAVSVVVLLLAAEGLMRVLNPVDPASLPAAMAARTMPGDGASEALPTLRTPADLSTPNVKGIFRGHLHRTDAVGFRGPAREAVAPAGTRRVIVTGGSITMGSGVAEDDAYPAVSERMLNTGHAPPRWELVNAALAGANLATVLDRLETGIAAYHPDLYVYAYNLDDIKGAHYRDFPAQRTALDVVREAGWPARSSSALIRVTTWWWLGLWDEIQRLNRDHYAHTIDFNYFENPQAWQAFLAGLDRLLAIAERDDRCVVMLTLTRLEDLDPRTHPFLRAYERTAQAAVARGFVVADAAPDVLGQPVDALRHSPLDPHPNAAGHRRYATTLTRALASLPPACWLHSPGVKRAAP